jgi:predicted metal-dependent peptidase
MSLHELEKCPTRKRLITSRVRLLINKPFFGNLITRLPLVDATDFGWCKTAATDAKYIYYNRNFVDKLRDGEVDFLFGHELLHCVYDHLGRRNGRQHLLWNIANDFVVNDTLVQEGVGELITTVKACYDPKYRNLASEEVYEDLLKQQEEMMKTFSLDDLLDQHLDLDGGDGSEDGEQGQGMPIPGAGADTEPCKDGDKPGGKPGENGPPKYTEEEKKKIRDEFKNSVIQAAQSAGAGNVPAGVARMIKELTEPKMDWRELLDVDIASQMKDDYTFMKPSRRNWHSDAIMPGMKNASMVEADCVIDASGSMTDRMVADVLAEVKGIMTQFDDFKLRVFSFDTAVYGFKEFTPYNIDEIDTYEVEGGGGTDFEVVWTFMKENDIEPKKLIFFTDGYPWGSWGDPDYCDTFWLLHSYHDKAFEAPFGQTAHYEAQAIAKAA